LVLALFPPPQSNVESVQVVLAGGKMATAASFAEQSKQGREKVVRRFLT
jgi:hypothetical protein